MGQRRRAALASTLAIASAISAMSFALATSGCDSLSRARGGPRHSASEPTQAASGDGGADVKEGGAPSAPAITWQPGDVQL
jgi:hypothetical protein